VGRDYNSILKTKLGSVLIDDSEELAKKRASGIFKGWPEEQIRKYVVYGTADSVIK
jgi:hypothetical protein